VPKIVMHERHFEFLLELVDDYMRGAWTVKPDFELANELKVILTYTRNVKQFTVEIADDDNGVDA